MNHFLCTYMFMQGGRRGKKCESLCEKGIDLCLRHRQELNCFANSQFYSQIENKLYANYRGSSFDCMKGMPEMKPLSD